MVVDDQSSCKTPLDPIRDVRRSQQHQRRNVYTKLRNAIHRSVAVSYRGLVLTEGYVPTNLALLWLAITVSALRNECYTSSSKIFWKESPTPSDKSLDRYPLWSSTVPWISFYLPYIREGELYELKVFQRVFIFSCSSTASLKSSRVSTRRRR